MVSTRFLESLGSALALLKQGVLMAKPRKNANYNRAAAERRFAHVYETVEGDHCVYCGMPSDGKHDHQPPVYVLHRFANGRMVTKRQIREAFGTCRLVPCCTICNRGLGAYHGNDDNDRRREILEWFVVDDRFPDDQAALIAGYLLLKARFEEQADINIYRFPEVGRAIYIEALLGLMNGDFASPRDFPEWLKIAQIELAEWLRQEPRRKSQHFLDMAHLASYDLVPDARSDPRGQFASSA